MDIKNILKECWNIVKIPTSSIRRKPDFLIIGAQKSGTTSLFNFLAQHPLCRMPTRKEIHYFDLNYKKGLKWYMAHFPFKSSKITGEATPYYLFHPEVAERVKVTFPNIKIIVILRNPIKRAFSHFQMERRKHREDFSDFFEAVKKEKDKLLEVDKSKLQHSRQKIHQNKSYLSRGLYYEQLKRWFSTFDKQNILVLIYEDFFENPKRSFSSVCEFLGLPEYTSIKFGTLNKGNYKTSLNEDEYNYLISYFTEDLQMLEKDLGIKTHWF